MSMTQVADVYSNRYSIERPIAKGGMADVFLAHDQYLDRPVAVKVLFPEYARDPSFVERFRREAQNAAMLNHPNIVGVYDYGQEHGTYYIVMEYVEGRSLRDVLRSEGALPAMSAARITAEIAAALDFAHRHGVVHRDIKPGNVLITPSGQVKVADFGIAAKPMDAAQGLTQTGAVIGTATYFSPEQAQGHAVDGRTDVYALGVVLYEMLTGVAPFSAESPVAVAMKHVREQPIPPSQRGTDIPPDLERIVLTALTKDADARYQSAEDLRADLIRFARGRPLSAAGAVPVAGADAPTVLATPRAPATPATRAAHADMWQEPPRRWGPIVATLLGLALLAGVIGFLIFSGDKPETKSVKRIEVPNVVGQTYDQAKVALEQLGFKVTRRDEVSETPVEQVIGQRPEAGLLYPKGRTIVLTVSSKQVTIPNVVGQTFDEAQAALLKLQLQVQRVDQEAADQAPGTVLAVSPAAGTTVDKGAVVQLTVAAEPPVAVPDVRNQDQVQAQTTLQNAGFSVQVVATPSNTVPSGSVINTDPAPGAKAPKGSVVKMQVSTGPQAVDVPNVIGQACSAGSGALTSAGFNVTITGNPAGTVVNQSPSGGQAPPGSAVALTCT